MMSYTFSELLEWADNVSGTYSLVTHKKSWVKAWGMGRNCAYAQGRQHVSTHSSSGPTALQAASPFGAQRDLRLHPASVVLCSG